MDKKSMTLGLQIGRQIAGMRRNQTEVWETVIDTEVTQTDDPGYVVYSVSDHLTKSFNSGDNVRFTVNGVTETFTADGNSLGPAIGTKAFNAGEVDYYFQNLSDFVGAKAAQGEFRNNGTYRVKLEVNRVNLPKWSYNGTIFGSLPAEWDRETHPYALIIKYDEERYIFRAYSAPLDAITPDTNGNTHKPPSGTSYLETNCYDYNWLWWSKEEAKTASTSILNMGKIKKDTVVWSNFDILNLDGSVYLATSEPVPV